MGIKSSISLYSLQYQYLWGKMSLADIFQFAKNLGTDGIELLPDQMLHGAPEPEEDTLRMWDDLVTKYPMGLASDDVFLNTNLFANRELTKRECVALMKKEIRLAHRLGFHSIRMVSMVPAWILEPCLELAVEQDVTLNIEIHAGLGFGVKKTDEYIEEMLRLTSPYIGIVPDTSLFMRRAPRVMTEYCDRVLGGLNPDIVKYTDEVFESGTDFFQLNRKSKDGMDPKLKSLIKNDADAFYASNISGYENRSLHELDDLAPYIRHVHFKLYEMTKEGEEYSIDYREILQYLHDHGYQGYVSTEYEGNRWVLPDHEIPEIEQVTAHQKMIQKYIREIEG